MVDKWVLDHDKILNTTILGYNMKRQIRTTWLYFDVVFANDSKLQPSFHRWYKQPTDIKF